MNNELQLRNSKSNKFYKLLLIITIFYCDMYSASLFNQKFGQPIFNYLRYALLGMMFIVFVFRFLLFNKSQKRIIIIICLIFFTIYNFLFGYGSSVAVIVIFCAYATFLKPREIIKSYIIGLTTCVIFVFMLSFIGVLPVKTTDGFLTYGFGNPNSIGGVLACVFMSALYLYWKKAKFPFLLLYVLGMLINFFTFGDRSASICMLIYLLFYFFKQDYTTGKIISWMGILSPTILTIFSLICAYSYGKYNWVYKIDTFLTRRVYTWNYYLNINGLHFLPHSLNIVKANEFELSLYGSNVDPLLRGFFDGGYMYLILRMGIIDTIIIIALLAYYFFDLKKRNQYPLEILLLIFIFFTFSENEWIVPYGFCVSYLLVICFSESENNVNSVGGK